ncbi:MAG TPA: hypothetical protein VF743_10420 [Acidimicrobiales bacterium]
MVAEPLMVEFRADRREPVVERMAALAAGRSGWINLSPGLDVDVPPPARSPLAGVLSGRGPAVPLATWTPGDAKSAASAGIQHGRGPKAADQLAEAGAPVPDGWRVVQDHAKRGLVLTPPAGTSAAELDAVLAWLLRATAALCPLPTTGEWRAYCYEPR